MADGSICGKRERAGQRGLVAAQADGPCHRVSCRCSATPSFCVQGAVDGRPCWMVVDTGAEATFVRKDMLEGRALPMTSTQLCGATGDCLSLQGPVEVSIDVGRVKEDLPVYAGRVEDECLLGMDYLEKTAAVIDVGRQELTVQGEVVPLLPAAAQVEAPETRHVPTDQRLEDQEAAQDVRCQRGAAVKSPGASAQQEK